jgi:hypothetical protein
MDKITLTQFGLSFAGLLLMWLAHLRRSRMKNKTLFSWAKYWNGNWDLLAMCLVSTIALLYLTDIVVLFGLNIIGLPSDTKTTNADNVIAFIGGLLNLKVVNTLKNKVIDKMNTR